MLKKFVPLNSNASPSKNPNEVRTYIGETTKIPEWKVDMCQYERKCPPENSTIAKVLTIEDELRRLHQKARMSRFNREVKKKCDFADQFTMCVVPQRTPRELRRHAVTRERYLSVQNAVTRRVHDGYYDGVAKAPSLIQLESPGQSDGDGDEEGEREDNDEVEEGEEEEDQERKPIKPRLASPECSVDMIFLPPKKMLELKRPKSGMFHNETEEPDLGNDEIPYSTYNPRQLQEQFDNQGLKQIDLIKGDQSRSLWTWNIGLQMQESDLDRAFLKATIPDFDYNHLELTVYNIPRDLDKTFTAEIVFGGNKVPLAEEPKNNKKSYYNRPKEIACLFVAYVESFRVNPDFWTAETMDAILDTANKLLRRSIIMNYKATDMDFDIIPQITERQALIGLKIHFTGPLKNEPNIYKTLSLYFSKYSAAVLCAKNLYLLIWKRCQNSFYVFDPNGRNELCQRDFENGNCSLMATRHVEHLVHLIVNFSDKDMQGEFNLYEIFLVNYGKIVNPMSTRPFPKRTRKLWAVVNNTYALIPAVNSGLQQPLSSHQRNASMLISLLALLYADIERASQWRMEVLDELIKYGEAYYKRFKKLRKFKKNQHVNITELPNRVLMGAFRATVATHPFLYTGHVADCKNFLDSHLTHAVKNLFLGTWDAALLQIDNSVVALWRDKDYFYLFDPFRRGRAGQVMDPDDYRSKGVAVLQMHTNFESFSRILYNKALKMRRGGKFFLHGVKVGYIKPQMSSINAKNKYPRLQLTFPKYEEDADKKSKLERHGSIHTIPDIDRIPEFEEVDVVNSVLEEVLFEIFSDLPEPILLRPHLYKKAEKVLLRSDKAYLESLKYKVKHGEDYDNIQSAFQTHPEPDEKPANLEEELQIPSNFEVLPDGTWVIFGCSALTSTDDETTKLVGLISSLVTAALVSKYKISTWNDELIEYALKCTEEFSEEYKSYENMLSAMLSKQIPKISIGQNTYCLKVTKITKSALTRSMRQVLLGGLICYNRLIVVCQRFSCLIVKRYNFLYMFIGFPCNSVGYRKFSQGPGCMLRFVELDSLIRRIEFGCNPQGCEIANYVVVALKVTDITNEPAERFRRWPKREEDEMYAIEREKQRKLELKKLNKMRFLDEELRKENERIEKFLMEKSQRAEQRKGALIKKTAPKAARRKEQYDSEYEEEEFGEFEDEYEEYEEEEEESVKLKHIPGKKMKREAPDKFKPRPILFGYRLREKDLNYKIQGSTAIEGREEASLEEIKACFFASTLAVLYVIMRPLNQWGTQRVDRVVESGKAIASKVTNMTTAFERVIKKVTVDDYEFDVWVKTFEPAGVWCASVCQKIFKATQTRHYILLQLSNCTFAIYRDEFYHLFDPYASMETLQDAEEVGDEEEEETNRPKKKLLKGIKRYGERNTASWVLFADVEAMLMYIDHRAANPGWKDDNEFKFHVVDILSYRKAASKTRMLQLLTDLSVPMECKLTQHGKDESTICAHNETLSWLDLDNCLPVWSRLNRRNTAGRYRNLALSKYKKYDIEIVGRLWSLWGNLHPMAAVFEPESRGKQYLAINVMACCAATVYRLSDWSPQLLDAIVISGDRYHRESLANIKQLDYEFSLEDLNLECTLENIKFVVHLEHVAYGKLYCTPTYTKMNMAEALMYFFGYFQFGILQCQKKSFAIGRTMDPDGGYFMFDCQSRYHPVFPKGQGAAYLLRTKHIQVLLYCIVVTLNIPYFNVPFTLHKVEMLREGASMQDDGENEEEEKSADDEEV